MVEKPAGDQPTDKPANQSAARSGRSSAGRGPKKAAAQRIAAQRAESARQARRRRLWTTGGSTLGIVVVIVIIIAVGVATHHAKSGAKATAASSTVTSALAGVPTSAFDAVDLKSSGYSAPPKKLSGQSALTADGKPEVLYIGAEYCPFCAAQRWPLTVALERFGDFSGLKQTTSSASDSPASVPTLSYYGSTYKSDYINFTSVETETNQVNSAGTGYTSLQSLTADQENLLKTVDVPTGGGQAGGIPFVDYANAYAQVDGSNFSPTMLSGLTDEQIAGDLTQPTSKVGAAILGSANAISAYICKIDGGKPADVCTSKGVVNAATELGAGS